MQCMHALMHFVCKYYACTNVCVSNMVAARNCFRRFRSNYCFIFMLLYSKLWCETRDLQFIPIIPVHQYSVTSYLQLSLNEIPEWPICREIFLDFYSNPIYLIKSSKIDEKSNIKMV